MRFTLTEEQRGFAASLGDLLAASDPVGCARAWAEDDLTDGLALVKRLADLGVCGLAVPEEQGGLGATPVDLVVALEQLGRHAVPGPWVETTAYLPALLAATEPQVVAALASGALGTVALRAHGGLAPDADVAAHLVLVEERDGDTVVHHAAPGDRRRSVDPSRRLFTLEPTRQVGVAPAAAARAFDLAALGCAAQLLGLGEHLLATTVTYVQQRRQFGRPVGSYQALKHRLADVRIALDFARPLVLGAACTFDARPDDPSLAVAPHRARDVSSAKATAADAAYLAARAALQAHGAVGYTAEHALSVWLLRTRALVTAWGTPAFHRGRVLAALEGRRRA